MPELREVAMSRGIDLANNSRKLDILSSLVIGILLVRAHGVPEDIANYYTLLEPEDGV